MGESKVRKALGIGALIAYSLVLLYPFVDSADRSEVFVDEVTFISAGHAAVTRLLDGDLLGPGWTAGDWTDYGWPNPMLSKLLMGAALYIGGHGGHEYRTYINQLPGPTPEELRAARWPSVLLGWGASLLMLALGWRMSPAAGFIASFYTAYNYSYVWSCALAMLEAPLMFFLVLTILQLLRLKDRLYRDETMRPLAWGAIGVGVAAGCAASSKLLGGSAVIFVPLFVGGLAVGSLMGFAPVPSVRRTIGAMLIATLAAPLTFYILNPQFYRNPIERFRMTLAVWDHRFDPTRLGEGAVSTRRQSFDITTHELLSVKTTSKEFYRPLFYKWTARWPAQKNEFERVYVNGRGSVEAWIMAFAILSIALTRWQAGRTAPVSDEEALLVYALFIWAVMIAWLPLHQGRYFLFPFIVTPPIVAIGLCRLGALVAAPFARLFRIVRPLPA